MRAAQCSQCGRFVKDVSATIRGWGEPEYIAKVEGTCSTHGLVEADIAGGWSWEDFYPETAPKETR